MERYETLREISRGGEGVVYEARDKITLACVAIKRGGDSVAAEARLLKELGPRHANIVSYLSDFSSGASHCLVMELCGASLQSISPLSESSCSKLLLTLLSALAAIHKLGIVHLDVKPSNMLLSMPQSDGVILADFGLAMRIGSKVVKESRGGSTVFMAPECLSRATPTPSADVWGLGASLYTLVAGRTLFEGMSQQAALLSLARDDDPAALSSPRQTPRVPFSATLSDLLNRCLVRDASLRPTIHDILQHPFFEQRACLGDECIAVPAGAKLSLRTASRGLPSPVFSPSAAALPLETMARPVETMARPVETLRAAADDRAADSSTEVHDDLRAAVAGRSLSELVARLVSLQLGRADEQDLDSDESTA
jgi:serine/threonine protein kinase